MLQNLEEYISDWHWSGIFKIFWPDGRISRFRYLMSVVLGFIGISMAICVMKYLLSYAMHPDDLMTFIVILVMSLLALVKIALSALVLVMLSIKRLHDINESGIWTFMLLLPPLGILLMIFLMIVPGYPFRNQHGLPPY